MMTTLLILILGLQCINGFRFFYSQSDSETIYQFEDELLIHTIIRFTKETLAFPTHMKAQWGKLIKPFALTPQIIAKMENEVTIQFNDLEAWIKRLLLLEEDIKSSREIIKLTKPMHYGDNTTVALDSDFESQIKTNIDDYVTKLVTIMETAGQIESIDKNNILPGMITMFELLNEDLKTYVTEYEKIHEAVTLAQRKVVSDELRDSIIDGTKDVDGPLKLEIIHIGKEGNNFIVYTTRVLWKNPISGYYLVPISYYSYFITGQYFLTNRHQYVRKFTKVEREVGYHLHAKLCLEALNNHHLPNTLQHCKFAHSSESFFPTENGVMFYNISTSSISAINKQLTLSYKYEQLPFHVTFNGSLEFYDRDIGNVQITRYALPSTEVTEFSEDDRKLIKDKFHSLEEIDDTDYITLILQKEYEGIILNISFISILGLLYYIGRAIYHKIKMRKVKTKSIHKAMTKRVKASKKENLPLFF